MYKKSIICIMAVVLISISAFGQENLATTSIVTACNSTNLSYLKDGNDATKWSNGSVSPVWVKLQMTRSINFATIKIDQISAPQNFTIDASNDNVTWFQICGSTAGATLFNKTNIYKLSGNNFQPFKYIRININGTSGQIGEISVFEGNLVSSFSASANYADPYLALDGNPATISNNNNPGVRTFDLILNQQLQAATINFNCQYKGYEVNLYKNGSCVKSSYYYTLGGNENLLVIVPGGFNEILFKGTTENNMGINEIFVSKLALSGASMNYGYNTTGNMYSRTIVISSVKSAHLALGDTIVYIAKPLEDKFSEHIINIFPNPTSGIISVSPDNYLPGSKFKLQMFTSSGIIFLNQSIDKETIIDISKKPSGVYILKIFVDGETHTWTIIKE